MKNQAFLLIDCNNFFVSCEKVFNPSYHKKPVVVLSNNDGCVISRSQEAKQLGVSMGMPAFEMEKAFRNRGIISCSANFALYGDLSKRVIQTIKHFCGEVEVYSIDETFVLMDLSDIYQKSCFLKDIIFKWTGIPVSIGIGPTKTLAKIANYQAKKNPSSQGIYSLLEEETQEKVLKALSPLDVWGIGRRMDTSLNNLGIHSAWDLRNAEDGFIKKKFSVMTLRTVWELRGFSCLSLSEVEAPKKSVLCSRTFRHPVTTLEDLQEAISTYTVRAVEKIRQQGSLASYIDIYVTTSRHQDNYYGNSRQVILKEPSSYAPLFIESAKKALKELFVEGLSYKTAGVALGGLVQKNSFQKDLFSSVDKDVEKKQEAIMNLIEETNKKWGEKALKFAALGLNSKWKTPPTHCSSRYTTRWTELLVVK